MRKEAPKINHPYIFSVSQVETFLLCQRKWAYNKIDKIADPGNEASKLGGDVHDQLEKYLESGTPIRPDMAGRIAMSALPFLPPPKHPGMRVEEWFHLKLGNFKGAKGDGAYLRGLKDLEIPGGWKSARPFVSDHKTTKNFMWMKTPEVLSGGASGVGDTQAGLYAYDTMVKTGAMDVDLQWTYMATSGPPKAQPSNTIITWDQASRVIQKLEEVTEQMIVALDENPTASTVIQNPGGCDAFGGCPYKSLCNLGPREKLRAIMTQANAENSVLAKLNARKAAKSGVLGAATSVASAAPAAPPAPPAPAAPAEPAAPAAPPAPVVVSEPIRAVDAAINPPEFSIAPEVTEEQVLAGKKGASKKVAKAVEEHRSGGILSAALDAFFDVIADGIASRVAEKLRK